VVLHHRLRELDLRLRGVGKRRRGVLTDVLAVERGQPAVVRSTAQPDAGEHSAGQHDSGGCSDEAAAP
jgi:hypothetical protein